MLKSPAADVFGIEVDPCNGGMSLADFEWRYRVLVVFPDDSHALATRQENLLLADVDGLNERDILVFEVGRYDVKVLFGPDHDLSPHAIRYDLDVTEGRFEMILVGKDGAVKMRSEEVVELPALFGLIDQMPMRRNERAN